MTNKISSLSGITLYKMILNFSAGMLKNFEASTSVSKQGGKKNVNGVK